MLYALLIYEDAKDLEGQFDTQREHASEMGPFVASIADKIRGGAPLVPASSATTVRVRDGETLTTDGPFAETKEVLAGFFLVEFDDLDQALEAAGRIPVARTGSIEVRPVALELMDAVNTDAEAHGH